MARTLHFLGQQIGTGLVQVTTAHAAATPAAVLTGLFQTHARVVSESINLVFTLRPVVYHRAADEIAFAAFAHAIQSLLGMTGLMEIKEGSTVKIRFEPATLLEAGEPQVAEAFGGRFTRAWALAFTGAAAPVWM